MPRSGCVTLLAIAWFAVSAAANATPLDSSITLNLAAQPLGDALRALAKAAGLQILFDAQLVIDRVAAPLSGALSPRAALAQMLRGTPLEAREQTPGIIIIRVQESPSSPATVEAARPVKAAANPEFLGELMVTAERRRERLQDVPISVSAYDQDLMDAQGMRTFDDVARQTPGVDFGHGTNYNSESSVVSIRGIASTAGAATTGVYIDDTPVQSRHMSYRTFDVYPQLFDLDRVEVLRGPQGTLFGSGSEGGTIRFITPEPDLHNDSGYSRVEAGATSHAGPVAELGLAAGGPLVDDTIAFRVSASERYEGGYVDRVDWHTRQTVDPEANAGNTHTLRLALKLALNDLLSVTPAVYHQSRHVDDTAAWWQPTAGTFDPTQGQFAMPFRNGNAVANPSTDAFTLASLKWDWDVGAARLLSNTSYFKRNQSAVTDYTEFDRAVFLADPYPAPGVQAPAFWAENQTIWTQELRLESKAGGSRVQWTAGFFYQHAYQNSVENVFDPALVTQLGFAAYDGGYLYRQDPFSAVDQQAAVFGQLDAKLTDALSLTLGLRYAKTDYTGDAYYAGPVVGTPVASAGSLTEHPVTPKVGLSFRLDADKLLYATLSKGSRIGGTNPAVGRFCYGGAASALGSIGLTQPPPKYDADSVWSYEIGSKNSFAEQRIVLDVSAYLIRWDNIQQNVSLSECGFDFTANLGKAQSRGFDVKATAKMGRVLTSGATLSVTDARYTQTVQFAPDALSIIRNGDRLPGAPWTASVFAQADFTAFNLPSYARFDFQYAAQQAGVVPNKDPLDGAHGLWFPSFPAESYSAGRLGVTWGGYDLSLYAQNLFDTRPRLTVNQDVASAEGRTPLSYILTWRPRTVGVTLTFRH